MVKVALTSLGCTRNLVDSEVILGSLKKGGFEITKIDKGADILIINTCAFVESARKESIEVIMEAAELKKQGKVRHIVLCGCLPQLYKDDLLKELPEVDLVVGTSDFPRIKDALARLSTAGQSSIVTDSKKYLYNDRSPRLRLIPEHYAYVKISEGCDNLCSYCIISRLRGRLRSRTISSVIKEIEKLGSNRRLKEVDLIGQDITAFGIDRYGRPRLAELLKDICSLKNSVKWVRLLYTHPAHYTDRLIATIREEERICKYLDLPIQHIDDKILKAMNRRTTRKEIAALIEKLRSSIPGLVLRTSIIVGFPGESDKSFKALLDFVRTTRFERLGAFTYSREDGTRASKLSGQVPDKVKNERFSELMLLQQEITRSMNRSFLGEEIEVLIDERVRNEPGTFFGRTYGDAPEVDGLVYVRGKDLKVGEFYKVKVTDTLEYDLVAEPTV